jgi:hypothetical protein
VTELNQVRTGSFLIETMIESLVSLRLLGHRSVLALLGIAVGCASVIALLNIGHNAANESINSFKGLGSNTVIATFPAQPGSNRPAPSTLDIQALIAALPMIKHVAPITLQTVRITHKVELLTPQLLAPLTAWLHCWEYDWKKDASCPASIAMPPMPSLELGWPKIWAGLTSPYYSATDCRLRGIYSR